MTAMNPRHTVPFCTIPTSLSPEQINTVLGKITFIEPVVPYTSRQRAYHYHYEQDVLFYGTLNPGGFALRRLSWHPSLYPYLIGIYRETPTGTDIDIAYNPRHFTDVAMLMALFGMPAGIIFVIGLFLGWWESPGQYFTFGGAALLPFVAPYLVRMRFRDRLRQDRLVLARVLVPASLESDGWVRNVINERVWGSGRYAIGGAPRRPARGRRGTR